MARALPVSVVETPEFLSATVKLMTEDERARLVDCLAYNPAAGSLIQGTGGLRKLEMEPGRAWQARRCAGDHFYHDPGMPLFCLTAYAKSERPISANATAMISGDWRRFWSRHSGGDSREPCRRQHPSRPPRGRRFRRR